jgi:RNA 2',3'-cyclic 3'-phosphodiesterase
MAIIRAFVAMSLPVEVRDHVASVLGQLADRAPRGSVRWVTPDNVHLTLRFLGDTQVELIPRIAAALDAVGGEHGGFELRLAKTGCFPNPRRPRVIWIGLDGETAALSTLHGAVERALAPLGWPPEEREFSPHLTLGRVKDSRKVVEARLPWGQQHEPRPWRVEEVHLVESRLLPTGAVYTKRHTSRLAGSRLPE